MQHILIIGKVWPEPGSSAAGSRTLQLIELFGEWEWRVSFVSAAAESAHAAALENIGVAKFHTEINSASFDELLISLQPSVVVFDRFTTEEQFGWRVAQHCPQALRILDTIDLHCLRVVRQAALKENREFSPQQLLSSDVALREIAAIYRCDMALMVSEFEIDLLQHLFKVNPALLFYMPLVYEPISAEQAATWQTFTSRQHFVSIGNFLHAPNWDTVQHLKQHIWPLIRKKLNRAELHVYGAYATQKVFELHQPKEGFLIKGRADNAITVMSAARVLLAPLRFGAGIKGKLLDAMLSGTPSVTTAIGAEAMHQSLPWCGTVAATAQEFADAAAELYSNETKWREAQHNGLCIINSVFSREKHKARLFKVITELLNNLVQHRLCNFTGAMLVQQAHAATKYMALWIEEKNKAAGKI